MKEDLLRIHNLSCGYGGSPILTDIDLRVSRGEFLGVIGPNGSGKTTLLRAITRILKPQKGSILMDGKDLRKMSHKELAKACAVAAQIIEPALMTVKEYVLLGRLPYFKRYQFFETRNDETIVQKYMELTDTIKLEKTRMNELSGGERQLASIARALAQEPSLLLLDEPTSHLDITHQLQILDLITRLNRILGLTVMIVLHDLNLASEYCSRLVLLNEGSAYKIGIPGDVLTYGTIQEVYKTEVRVERSPISGRPCIFVVPEMKNQ
jgi:iron complex transport system ATP-binding protein